MSDEKTHWKKMTDLCCKMGRLCMHQLKHYYRLLPSDQNKILPERLVLSEGGRGREGEEEKRKSKRKKSRKRKSRKRKSRKKKKKRERGEGREKERGEGRGERKRRNKKEESCRLLLQQFPQTLRIRFPWWNNHHWLITINIGVLSVTDKSTVVV